MTESTSPNEAKASISAAGWSVSASRSRSPIDSRRRRNEPAGSIELDAGRRRQDVDQPVDQRLGACRGASARTDRRAWRSPRGRAPRSAPTCRERSRSRPSSAARRRSSTVSIPSSALSWRTVFGPRPGIWSKRDERRRHLGPEPLVERQVAGRGELGQLVADGLADARDLGRRARPVGRHDVDRAATDGVGGAVVGDGLEHELALELEHVADLVEDPGEVAVGEASAGSSITSPMVAADRRRRGHAPWVRRRRRGPGRRAWPGRAPGPPRR